MGYMEDLKEQLKLRLPTGNVAGIIGAAGAPALMLPNYFAGPHGMEKVSEKDWLSMTKFMLSLYQRPEPHPGEWVRFANGAMVRVAYVWNFCSDESTPCNEHEHNAARVQTYQGGHYHLDMGYVSQSGSLNDAVPYSTFKLTNELRLGSAWIWHDGWSGAQRGIDGMVSFRVWESTAIPRDYLPCGDCGCFWSSHSVGPAYGWSCHMTKHSGQRCTKLYHPSYEKAARIMERDMSS